MNCQSQPISSRGQQEGGRCSRRCDRTAFKTSLSFKNVRLVLEARRSPCLHVYHACMGFVYFAAEWCFALWNGKFPSFESFGRILNNSTVKITFWNIYSRQTILIYSFLFSNIFFWAADFLFLLSHSSSEEIIFSVCKNIIAFSNLCKQQQQEKPHYF